MATPGSPAQSTVLEPNDNPAPPPPVMSLEDVGSQPTIVKCMGRTYSVAAARGEVFFSDHTDVTNRVLLGTALPHTEHGWDVFTVRGERLLATRDVFKALVTLREAALSAWPSLTRGA